MAGIGGAALGAAIGGPVGATVGAIAGSISFGGSPRYEGGPLYSSVVVRLQEIRAGDATAVAQSKADAITGGAGWKDVGLVLAPTIRPDLFGPAPRALTPEENQLVTAAGGPLKVPTSTTTPGTSPAPGAGGPAPVTATEQLAALGSGGVNMTTILGAAILAGLVYLIVKKHG